jgi:hypothetical protein
MTATYDKIATYTAPSPQSSYTFTTISQAYTDLVLVYNGTVTVTGKDIRWQFNGDTGGNYSYTYINGNGSTAASGRLANSSYIPSYATVGSSANPATILFHVMNYSNTTTYKTALMRASDAGAELNAYVGLWRNTAAITSIKIFPNTDNFSTGSTFTLYGIKAA